jgi:IS30 family transposase
MPAAAAAASWLLLPRRFVMYRLRWWLVSGAGIPWSLRIGTRLSSTHPTGQRACRRPANFIVGRHLEVNAAAIHAISEHRKMFRTITFDNGTEFHDYKQLESKFSIRCYFATPYHSWERGSNENLNGLIRQYVPKGACMKLLTQERCNEIAADLNTRPRKRHGFKTPSEIYYAS